MGRFRVIVTGDRNWKCRDLAAEVVARLCDRHGGENLVIVHGAATGVDAAFAEACEVERVAQEAHPADWERYGKSAGPRRNQEMVNARADLCIAVHRKLDASLGTKDMVRRCLAAGIPVWLISSGKVEPKRVMRA